jgi:hypothetical protein
MSENEESHSSDSDSDGETVFDTKKAAKKLVKADDGEEFDNERLRKYQLERLR